MREWLEGNICRCTGYHNIVKAVQAGAQRDEGGEAMTAATGIGASVKRKEDFRFLTGRGTYTDDINRPGQTYAYILRSPHAHAKIKKIDTSAAAKAPGVVAIFTGADYAGRQDRRPALRLADQQQGRLADGRAAASAARRPTACATSATRSPW